VPDHTPNFKSQIKVKSILANIYRVLLYAKLLVCYLPSYVRVLGQLVLTLRKVFPHCSVAEGEPWRCYLPMIIENFTEISCMNILATSPLPSYVVVLLVI
jgi:hypothetical protein